MNAVFTKYQSILCVTIQWADSSMPYQVLAHQYVHTDYHLNECDKVK